MCVHASIHAPRAAREKEEEEEGTKIGGVLIRDTFTSGQSVGAAGEGAIKQLITTALGVEKEEEEERAAPPCNTTRKAIDKATRGKKKDLRGGASSITAKLLPFDLLRSRSQEQYRNLYDVAAMPNQDLLFSQ